MNTAASENNTHSLHADSLSWIYLLKKERLIAECKQNGIPVEGNTVAELRSTLSAFIRTKRTRKSTENLCKELEREVNSEESHTIKIPYEAPAAASTVSEPRSGRGEGVMTPHVRMNGVEVMNTVRRWELHYSYGDGLHDFLERIEELADCYHIIPDQLLPTLPEVLRGKALCWFRVRRPHITTWAEFRAEASRFFLPKRHLGQLEEAIRQRKQQPREKAKDYILALQTLIRQHPQLQKEEHLERIYDGLRVEYRLFVKRCEFQTVEELMELTDDFELLKVEEARQHRPTAYSISTPPETYNSRNTCWRCKARGHHRSKCRRSAKIFCSRCGQDGRLSRNCPCPRTPTSTTSNSRNINPPNEPPTHASLPPGGKAYTRFYITITIEGLSIEALVDTGASLTYVGESVQQHLEQRQIPSRPDHSSVQLANQSCVNSMCTYAVNVEYHSRITNLLVSVIPNLAEKIILGMDFLTERGITLAIDGQPLNTSSAPRNECLYTLTEREYPSDTIPTTTDTSNTTTTYNHTGTIYTTDNKSNTAEPSRHHRFKHTPQTRKKRTTTLMPIPHPPTPVTPQQRITTPIASPQPLTPITTSTTTHEQRTTTTIPSSNYRHLQHRNYAPSHRCQFRNSRQKHPPPQTNATPAHYRAQPPTPETQNNKHAHLSHLPSTTINAPPTPPPQKPQTFFSGTKIAPRQVIRLKPSCMNSAATPTDGLKKK